MTPISPLNNAHIRGSLATPTSDARAPYARSLSPRPRRIVTVLVQRPFPERNDEILNLIETFGVRLGTVDASARTIAFAASATDRHSRTRLRRSPKTHDGQVRRARQMG
jgi:hypothetical protein